MQAINQGALSSEATQIWERITASPQVSEPGHYYDRTRYWVDFFHAHGDGELDTYAELLLREVLKLGVLSGHHQLRQPTRADGKPWLGEPGIVHMPTEHLPVVIKPRKEVEFVPQMDMRKVVDPKYYKTL